MERSDKVRGYINQAGFGGLLQCGSLKIDRPLIEALTEFWRPETHTFHLPFGEVTITLHDVSILMGLNTEGLALINQERSYEKNQLSYLCMQYLGLEVAEQEFKGYGLKLSIIIKHIINNPLTENSGEMETAQQARCVILLLCSCLLFCDQINAHASLHLLPHLMDLSHCGNLSCGSATLACLYRNLCKSTHPSSKWIGGPMVLLQMWVWARIFTLRPTITNIEVDPQGKPYGARWQNKLSFKKVSGHVLMAHRTVLQALTEREFIWCPYEGEDLPAICFSGMASWRSRCYLIFWDVVEYHAPERVMRQFGYFQNIPRPIPISRDQHMALHNISRAGRGHMDWRQEHRKYVDNWNKRQQTVVVGENVIGVDPNYAEWYNRHTVKYVVNPIFNENVMHTGFQNYGGSNQLMVDGLRRVVQETDRYLGEPQNSQDQYNADLTFIRNTAVNVMGMVNHTENLAYPSHLQTDPVNLQTDNTAPRRDPRARERRGRRTNAGEGTSTNPRRASNYGEGSSSHHEEGPYNYGVGQSQNQFYNPSPNYAMDQFNFTELLGLQTPAANMLGFGQLSGFQPSTSQDIEQPRHSFSAFHPFTMPQNEGPPQFINFPAIPINFDYQTSQNMTYPQRLQNEESQEDTPQQVVEGRPRRQRFGKGCGTGGHL